MTDKLLLEQLRERWGALQAARSQWENVWEEVRQLVRPNAADFRQMLFPGEQRREKVFDNFPGFSLNVMAAGLHGYLTSPAERWFGLTTREVDLDNEPTSRKWLEDVADEIYEVYGRAETGFNSQMHELYLELGSFGTAVLHIDDTAQQLILRTIPLAECYIAENSAGVVDTLFRKFELTTTQVVERFENVPDYITKARPDAKHTIIHAVYPRGPKNKDPRRWRSVYFDERCQHIFSDGGFRNFPYIVVRWSKIAGETYGRSPAMDALQDIRVLNELSRTYLQALQLTTMPPLLVDDDGVLGKITLKPWGFIYRQPNARGVEPLPLNPRIELCLDAINRKHDTIGRFFFNDLFNMPNYGSRDRVTALEVSEGRDDRLRQLAPVIGRLEMELLGPLIHRSYEFLAAAEAFPPPPPKLRAMRKLKIHYLSPAARSLGAIRAANIQRFMSELLPLVQTKPELLDRIDFDVVITTLARAREIPAAAILTDQDVQAIRADRQQQAQAQQTMMAGLQASQALKNVASARQGMPELMEGML